jgi:hypothetical protein
MEGWASIQRDVYSFAANPDIRGPMKSSRTRKQANVAKQALQIAALTPAVAAARLTRVAATGNYGALGQMGAEKATTFTTAAVGMMFAGAAAFAKSAFVIANACSPWGGSARQRATRVQSALVDASTDISRAGLTPIRKRVVANSKRLGR